MTYKNLFIILPRQNSEKEKKLFDRDGTFYLDGEEDKGFRINLLVEKILSKEPITKLTFKEKNREEREKIIESIITKIKREENIIVLSLKMEGGNPSNEYLYEEINKNYNVDCARIIDHLGIIEDHALSVLKSKWKIIEDNNEISRIIVAAHTGGKTKEAYMEIQENLSNEILKQEKWGYKDKLKFVYYSSQDDKDKNDFIKENFEKYSYKNFMVDRSDEQFQLFLKLLIARAEGRELDFFGKKSGIKGNVFELLGLLMSVYIDCYGIAQLRRGDSKRRNEYEAAAFKEGRFKTQLDFLKSKITKLKMGMGDENSKKIECLMTSETPEEFLKKYEESRISEIRE